MKQTSTIYEFRFTIKSNSANFVNMAFYSFKKSFKKDFFQNMINVLSVQTIARNAQLSFVLVQNKTTIEEDIQRFESNEVSNGNFPFIMSIEGDTDKFYQKNFGNYMDNI